MQIACLKPRVSIAIFKWENTGSLGFDQTKYQKKLYAGNSVLFVSSKSVVIPLQIRFKTVPTPISPYILSKSHTFSAFFSFFYASPYPFSIFFANFALDFIKSEPRKDNLNTFHFFIMRIFHI